MESPGDFSVPLAALSTAFDGPRGCAGAQGKSTLSNWLLQDERCLTGPEPGLTRDAVQARSEH